MHREPSSALIKGRGSFGPPPAAAPPRTGSLIKRGTMAHREEEQALYREEGQAHAASAEPLQEGREAPPEPARPSVVHIPTGDPRPQAAAPLSAPIGSATEMMPQAPIGPALDQQILEDAKRRAEAILRQAQMDAKKMAEESKIFCQNAFAESEREGYKQGQQRGYQDALRETTELVLGARTMYAHTLGARERLLRSLQPEVARLAMKIADRVTATAAAANPEIVANQVLEALERVKDREQIRVHVAPDDLDQARQRREVFEKMLEGAKSFDIVSDPKVDRGGCVIETNLGNVDARIQTQLGALQIAFDEIERRERQEIEDLAEAAARSAMPPPEPPPPAEEAPPPPPPAAEGG